MKTNLWIARDENGDLYIYGTKPIKSGEVFTSEDYCEEIDRDLYPEVTWDNSPVKLIVDINK